MGHVELRGVSWMVAALMVAATGCGSNKADSATPCPMNTAAGAKLLCMCKESAPLGITTCQDNQMLTSCNCEADPAEVAMLQNPAGAAVGSMMPTSGTGGAIEPPATGGAMSPPPAGTGGTTGPAMEPMELPVPMPQDAGSMTENDAMVPPEPQGPGDGTQLAACTTGADCAMGFECYTGGGFCSKACTTSADCTSVSGGDYTCYTAQNVCRIICMGADDTTSCPDGLECVDTNPIPLMSTFRCVYP